jgi:hypothetical protein
MGVYVRRHFERVSGIIRVFWLWEGLAVTGSENIKILSGWRLRGTKMERVMGLHRGGLDLWVDILVGLGHRIVFDVSDLVKHFRALQETV